MMREAIRYLNTVSRATADHELYRWITSSYHADARRHYDCFVPMLNFIMTFPYYNERYLSYGDAVSSGAPPEIAALRQALNEQVSEDKTHSRFFLHDFRRFDLAAVWQLTRPSMLLWTLWASPMLDPVRAIQSDRIRAIVDEQDEWPPYRYLHTEEIELDGNLLFTAATDKAREVAEQNGAMPIYFGMHHLHRESGHVGQSEFLDVPLSEQEAAHAKQLIDYKSGLSASLNDFMLRFARSAEGVAAPGVLLAREYEEHLRHFRTRMAAHLAGQIPAPKWHIRPVEAVAEPELMAAWQRHHRRYAEHPFVALLNQTPGADAGFALRCIALLFATRLCGFQTFYAHDGRIREPAAGSHAQIIRFLGSVNATQSTAFFHDWDVLAMDRRIPWSMAKLLEWWYLDPKYGRPELETIHEFRRQILHARDNPVIIYWAFMAIHGISRAFFPCSSSLAERFAAENPHLPPLMFMKNVLHLGYERASPEWAAPSHPTSLGHLPVTPAERLAILHLMEVFCEYGLRQFDNLVSALTTDRAQFAFLADQTGDAS